MRFLDFKKKLENFVVFNLNDIRKIESNFDLRRLSEWQNKNYIKMIRRGHYIFSDLKIDESALFLIANKIYPPSYVSLESALSYYNLIPEAVYSITSVTSRKTNSFENDIGKFTYRHIKPELMFGYKLVKYKKHNFKIAEEEKALLDYFYFNSNFNSKDDFAGIRFNSEEFKSRTNKNRFRRYLKAFKGVSFKNNIERFLDYINYA